MAYSKLCTSYHDGSDSISLSSRGLKICDPRILILSLYPFCFAFLAMVAGAFFSSSANVGADTGIASTIGVRKDLVF